MLLRKNWKPKLELISKSLFTTGCSWMRKRPDGTCRHSFLSKFAFWTLNRFHFRVRPRDLFRIYFISFWLCFIFIYIYWYLYLFYFTYFFILDLCKPISISKPSYSFNPTNPWGPLDLINSAHILAYLSYQA